MNIKSSITRIPGYQYNEYKLVLFPNNHVSDKILQVKKEFVEKYKININLELKPVLPLVHFIQFEMMEERLTNQLKIITDRCKPFNIELNGFKSFPTHTIYIDVESKLTVQNLLKTLKPAQQIMTLKKENAPHFIQDPHFIIAGKLLPWQYEQGWLHYSHFHFKERFIAEEMTLMTSPLNASTNESKNNYRVVQHFKFKDIPVTSTQGNLFQ